MFVDKTAIARPLLVTANSLNASMCFHLLKTFLILLTCGGLLDFTLDSRIKNVFNK
jgi:hypothetical protein